MGAGMGEKLLGTVEGVDAGEALSAIRQMDCLGKEQAD